MKLLICRECGDLVQMRPEARRCFCGASSGKYLEDNSTVQQSAGSFSLALHNHDFRAAIEAFVENPNIWHPLMVLRAYLNPLCENDVEYVSEAEDLDQIRTNIDQIDRQLVRLLAMRGNYVKKAASFKTTTEDVKAPKRVEQVIAKVVAMANEVGANPVVIESVYRTMIAAFVEAELKEHALLQEQTDSSAPQEQEPLPSSSNT
jgi:isochorismate pyruvate lyase